MATPPTEAPPTHWKTLYGTDRELYDLCYERSAKIYGHRHADPEEAPATLEVEYCAMGSGLTLDQIDRQAVSTFNWGACGYLTLELHRITGLPIAVFTEYADEIGWSGHAALALPAGNFLDIEGLTTTAEINARYSFHEPIEASFPELDEYCELMFRSEGSGAKNPYADLEPLEIRLLRHFAELVLQKNAISIPPTPPAPTAPSTSKS